MTTGLPILKAGVLSGEEAAVWVISVSQWYREQGIDDVVLGEEDAQLCPTGDYSHAFVNGPHYDSRTDQLGRSYALAGLSLNNDLRMIVSKEQHGPACWKKIYNTLLGGRGMQEVIHEMYTDLHQLHQPIEAFYNRFQILSEARFPQLPPKQLCIDFSSKLSPEYGTYCILAEENPGRADFNLFADKVINLIHSTTAREALHERQTGGGSRVNGMIAGSEWMAPYRKSSDSFGTQAQQQNAYQTAVGNAVQAELHSLGLGDHIGAFGTSAKGGKGVTPRPCINCDSTSHKYKDCTAPDANCSHEFCVEKGLTRHKEKYCFYINPQLIQSAAIRERVLKELAAGKIISPVPKVAANIVYIDGEGNQFGGEDFGDFQALLTTTNGLPALPTNMCSTDLFSSPHFFEYMTDSLTSSAIECTNRLALRNGM